jgi:hypothetical protein
MMSFVVGSIIAFDRLVQLQCQSYPDYWERDGKPRNCNRAWQRCSNRWMISTPVWIQTDERATRLLILFRVLGVLFLSALLGGIIYRLVF